MPNEQKLEGSPAGAVPKRVADFNALPLWRLCEIAHEDLKWAAKQENLAVNMGCWVAKAGGKCLVCLAGAVLYKECGWRSERKDIPAFADALNWLRVGCVDLALEELGRPVPENCPAVC